MRNSGGFSRIYVKDDRIEDSAYPIVTIEKSHAIQMTRSACQQIPEMVTTMYLRIPFLVRMMNTSFVP